MLTAKDFDSRSFKRAWLIVGAEGTNPIAPDMPYVLPCPLLPGSCPTPLINACVKIAGGLQRRRRLWRSAGLDRLGL